MNEPLDYRKLQYKIMGQAGANIGLSGAVFLLALLFCHDYYMYRKSLAFLQAVLVACASGALLTLLVGKAWRAARDNGDEVLFLTWLLQLSFGGSLPVTTLGIARIAIFHGTTLEWTSRGWWLIIGLANAAWMSVAVWRRSEKGKGAARLPPQQDRPANLKRRRRY